MQAWNPDEESLGRVPLPPDEVICCMPSVPDGDPVGMSSPPDGLYPSTLPHPQPRVPEGTTPETIPKVAKWSSGRQKTSVNKGKMNWIANTMATQRSNGNLNVPQKESTALQNFVRSDGFTIISCILILINAVLIGVETSVSDGDQAWVFVEVGFLGWYTLELYLRVMSNGIHIILMDRWIRFDVIVLLIAYFDLCMLQLLNKSTGKAKTLAMAFRITRLLKLVRLVRLLRASKELWLLVQSIGGAFRTLVWTFLLLLGILYIFGLLFFEVLGKENEDPEIRELFESLPEAMLTLFQIMTLDGWADIARPVWNSSQYLMCWVILVFILICSFAIFNVVMAVIVEHTISEGMDHHDNMIKKAQKDLQNVVEELVDIFRAADIDGSGTLGKAEFIEGLQDQNARKLLQKIGAGEDFALMDAEEIGMLFDTMDIDGTEQLTPQEFANGMLQMRGPARARSVFELYCEMQKRHIRAEEINNCLNKKLDAVMEGIQNSLQLGRDLAKRVDRVDAMQGEIQSAVHHNARAIEEMQKAVEQNAIAISYPLKTDVVPLQLQQLPNSSSPMAAPQRQLPNSSSPTAASQRRKDVVFE